MKANIDGQTILIGVAVLGVGFVVWKAASNARGLVSDTGVALGGAISTIGDAAENIVNAVNPFSPTSIPQKTITSAQGGVRSFIDNFMDWLPGMSTRERLDAAGANLIKDTPMPAKRPASIFKAPTYLASPFTANINSPMHINNTTPAWNDFSSFKLF